jgi:phytanoyl-CoA dioxygenase PhyH
MKKAQPDPDITFALRPAELQQYQRDGYLVRQGAFSSSELTTLHTALERACELASRQAATGREYFLDGKRFVDVGRCTLQFEAASTTSEIQSVFRVIEPIIEFDDAFDQLAEDPRLTAPIRSILNTTTLSLWTAKLNLKAPGGAGFGWHQDSPYWIHDCDHVDLLPNVMLTLDDQSIDNGCFEIVRGSHLSGMLPGTSNGTDLGGFYTDPTAFDVCNSVQFEVPAGSLIFFDPHCVHGSGINNSTESRRALIYTFQPGHQNTLKTGTLRPV